MPLRVHCPTGHVLMVPDERAGRAVKCPRCQQVVMVPTAAVRFDGEAKQAGTAQSTAAVPPTSAPPKPVPSKPSPPALATPKTVPPKTMSPATVPPQVGAARPLPPTVVNGEAKSTPAVPQKLQPNSARPPGPARPAATTPPKPATTASKPAQSPPKVTTSPVPNPQNLAPQMRQAAPSAAAPASPANVAAAAVRSQPAVSQPARSQPPVASPPTQSELQPVPPPPIANQGPEPDVITPPASQVAGAYQLAGVIVAVALFSMGPALWETLDYIQSPGLPMDRWTWLLFALGVVQIGYAVFMVQIPDWTTAWVVSVMSLVLAGGYGALLGIAVMSAEESGLIQVLQLDHEMADQKVAFWAIAMVSCTSLLSWYAGHCSGVWHRVESVLRRAGLAVE